MNTKPHPYLYAYMHVYVAVCCSAYICCSVLQCIYMLQCVAVHIYVYVYRLSGQQMHCAESYAHTLHTHPIHALRVAQVCVVGCQKVGGILLQCIVLICSHPRYSHALQAAQGFVGRQKIEYVLKNRIYRLTP